MQENSTDLLDNSIFSNFSFWKNIALVAVFLLITPLTLGASLFSLFFISDSPRLEETPTVVNHLLSKTGVRVYASIPSSFPSISGEAISADARIELLRQFLEKFNSPLEPIASYIVAISDQYGIDHRLTTAIAMKESGLCKAIPLDSFNCWGWGIHSEGTLHFESYEEALEAVTSGLKENYIDKGYISVEDIMLKYAHPDSTTWADGVNFYMAQMQ